MLISSLTTLSLLVSQLLPGNWWIPPNSMIPQPLTIGPSAEPEEPRGGDEDLVSVAFSNVVTRQERGQTQRYVIGTLTNTSGVPLGSPQILWQDIETVSGQDHIIGGGRDYTDGDFLSNGSTTRFELPFSGRFIRVTGVDTLQGSADINVEFRPTPSF